MNSTQNDKPFNSFMLKLIAVITMTIDHVGAVFGTVNDDGILPEGTYTLLRTIGRLAFPIFCYLLVDGFFYTRNLKKYILRLACFAILSQYPYSLAIHKNISFYFLNIFFTLTLGMIVIAAIHYCIYRLQACDTTQQIVLLPGIAITLSAFWVADNFNMSYGIYGIMLILIFYFFRLQESDYQNTKKQLIYLTLEFVLIGVITYQFSSDLQIYCLAALIPIYMHNHKKGIGMKYFFYLYYPLHLLVIYGIYMLIQ